MSTGIPRTHQKVVQAAQQLGYAYHHSTGGHDFYVHPDPDEKLGQEKRLTIPSKIKGTKTLYNILDGMGYFEAHGLGHDGSPRAAKIDIEREKKGEHKQAAQFISLTREWKKALKRHTRGLMPHPGHPPVRSGPAPANTP